MTGVQTCALPICDCHVIKNDWVEHEVRMARELELKKEMGCDVLCPIALDDCTTHYEY